MQLIERPGCQSGSTSRSSQPPSRRSSSAPHSRKEIQIVEHHRRKVSFFSTIEFVNAVEQEKARGKAGKIAEGLIRLDLVVLDELGYLPFGASGGALLFQLLSELNERTSVITTTNLMRMAVQ